jgi:MFS family permease
MVGFVTALGFLPILLFALIGGVIVDRFQKRQVLIWTQAGQLFFWGSTGSISFKRTCQCVVGRYTDIS